MATIVTYIISALVSSFVGLYLGASINAPVGGMILLNLITSTCFILYAVQKNAKSDEQDKAS